VTEHYHQVEIEFQLGGAYARDVDLLEDLGIALEEIADETGPSAAIHGDRYSVTLILPAAATVRDAGTRAAEIVTEALNQALAKRGDELDAEAFEQLVERMLVEHAKPPVLAMA
jgi:hypothetical protein